MAWVRFTAAVALAALMFGSRANAGETILYGSPGGWVKPAELPTPGAPNGGAVQLLLQNVQVNFGPDGDETYVETALKVLTPQGLQQAGQISQIWDPSIADLTINKLQLVRNGEVIDLLARGQKFVALRREDNLSMAMLDGRLTANVQIQDLRIGDIVRLATTEREKDPAKAGRSELLMGFGNPTPIPQMSLRVLWGKDKPIRWQAGRGVPKLVVSPTANDGSELLLTARDFTAAQGPENAPGRYALPSRVDISQYKDWREVSATTSPLFQRASELSAASEIKAEAAKIRAKYASDAERAFAALKLVQTEIRYLYLAMGQGGYVPASADETWSRRFGDCKVKTVLLLAMLRELGIAADPVLVSADGADGLDKQLPRLGAFNHVLVRARIEGKSYWLDGTLAGSTPGEIAVAPPMDWGLPLTAAGADLEKLEVPPARQPLQETFVEMDATRGIDRPASFKVEMLFRGMAAAAYRARAETLTPEKFKELFAQGFTEGREDLDLEEVDFAYDEASNTFRLLVVGESSAGWDEAGKARVMNVPGSVYAVDFQPRTRGLDREAPFLLAYPYATRQVTRVRLPQKGDGFSLLGDNIDKTISGMQVSRRSRIEDGVAVVELNAANLAREIAYKDALESVAAFDALATAKEVQLIAPRRLRPPSREEKAFFDRMEKAAKYVKDEKAEKAEVELVAALALANIDARDRKSALEGLGALQEHMGKHQALLATLDELVRLAPDDADMLNWRCWIKATRNLALASAIADCDAAVAKKPGEAGFLDSRAFAKLRLGDAAGSLADYDAALKLDPEMAESLYGRGLAKVKNGDPEGGERDKELALSIDSKVGDQFAEYGLK